MNKVIKKKWVDALRSGEYTQGYDILKSGEGEYCCLGVLCDLAVKENIAKEDHALNTFITQTDYYFDGERGVLPISVVSWAGLDSYYVQVEYKNFPVALDELNDAKGLTFNEIADLIEEQL